MRIIQYIYNIHIHICVYKYVYIHIDRRLFVTQNVLCRCSMNYPVGQLNEEMYIRWGKLIEITNFRDLVATGLLFSGTGISWIS